MIWNYVTIVSRKSQFYICLKKKKKKPKTRKQKVTKYQDKQKVTYDWSLGKKLESRIIKCNHD